MYAKPRQASVISLFKAAAEAFPERIPKRSRQLAITRGTERNETRLSTAASGTHFAGENIENFV
jgi:hypothetical protein